LNAFDAMFGRSEPFKQCRNHYISVAIIAFRTTVKCYDLHLSLWKSIITANEALFNCIQSLTAATINS
jgi:hypothetical protein